MSPQFGSHSMAAFSSSVAHKPLHHVTSNGIRYIQQHTSLPSYTSTSSTALNVALSHSPKEFLANPIGILGGAASTVAANTDTLSTAALVTMFLLAIQYCAQPPITRKFLDSRANKKGITMVEEIIKMGLAASFFLSCGKDVVSSSLAGWTLSSSLLLAGLPALLYATQGVLTYLGYQNTDSVTFNGLNQTKTLSAALWCFLLMGKRQSVVQMVALTILLFSALLFQGSISISGLFQKKVESVGESGGDDVVVNGGAKVEERKHTSISKGIIPCLAAAFISGLAGALSQKGVQLSGGFGRNPYLFTMELGLYSSCSLLFSLFATKNGRKSLREEGSLFKYWTPLSIIPITVRALGKQKLVEGFGR